MFSISLTHSVRATNLTLLTILVGCAIAHATPQDVSTTTVTTTTRITTTVTTAQPYGLFDPTRPCTGILVDARDLKDVKRTQSPTLLAAEAEPGKEELYPDPTCLPNYTELQENGIVRFYHGVDEARKGFIGDNPYIVHAIAIHGPFHGDLVVCPEDAAKLRELEKTVHYIQNWKVGFLLPDGK